MNKKILAVATVGLLSLAACGHKTDAADNVAAMADNQADAIDANAAAIREAGDNAVDEVKSTTENIADKVENRADAVRSAGENKADAIDKAAKK